MHVHVLSLSWSTDKGAADARAIVMIVLIVFALGWLVAIADKRWLPADVDPPIPHA